MKNLSKHILEAIDSGVRMGLSLDDFNDTDDKLPTLKKDIRSKSHNIFKECEYLLIEKIEKKEFDDDFIAYLNICKDFKWHAPDDRNFGLTIIACIK
jgi:surface protein